MTDTLDRYDEPEYHRRTYGVDRNTGYSDAPEDCVVCGEYAGETCQDCGEYLCIKHAVYCSKCGDPKDTSFCIDCLLALNSSKGRFPPYVLVDGKWLCENCVPEEVNAI